jgi:hypothetical protein
MMWCLPSAFVSRVHANSTQTHTRARTHAHSHTLTNMHTHTHCRYTDSERLNANDRHSMLLLQCVVESKLEKLANEELEEHSDPLWETFIIVKPREELSTDLKALCMLLRPGQEHVKAYLQRKLKDRSHPIGRLIQEFIDFFLAAYHGQEVLKNKNTARYFLHHACHDVHSFSSELCKLQVRVLKQHRREFHASTRDRACSCCLFTRRRSSRCMVKMKKTITTGRTCATAASTLSCLTRYTEIVVCSGVFSVSLINALLQKT